VIECAPERVGRLYDGYRFREAVQETVSLARTANKYFNDSEPWKSFKSSPERCATTIHLSLQIVRSLAILLQPVVPAIAQKIWSFLNLTSPLQESAWDSAGSLMLDSGHVLKKAEILISKIEDEKIQKVVDFLDTGSMAQQASPADAKPAEVKPLVSIDEFRKIDLKVAKVIAAEKVPKSEKLLKLQIEIGSEKRQIIAGVAQYYAPEQLTGKKIIVVANLQPVKVMGQQSNGMLLAANEEGGRIAVLMLPDDVPTGSIVR
jgi:methionyl-tRNA synthetase